MRDENNFETIAKIAWSGTKLGTVKTRTTGKKEKKSVPKKKIPLFTDPATKEKKHKTERERERERASKEKKKKSKKGPGTGTSGGWGKWHMEINDSKNYLLNFLFW